MPDHAESHGNRLSRKSRRTGRAADLTGREERAAAELLTQVPARFRADVEAWVAALSGTGRRPSRPVAWVTVRTYLQFAMPVLTDWDTRVYTLREITRADIEQALADHRGASEHNLHIALRSLFRGLKREKRTFTDPARGLVRHYARRLPRPLPSDRLRGLLDPWTTPVTSSPSPWLRSMPSASTNCATSTSTTSTAAPAPSPPRGPTPPTASSSTKR
jgi:hypothetical protein